MTLAEMAFATNAGLRVQLMSLSKDAIATLFNEEPGAVLQVRSSDYASVMAEFEMAGLGVPESMHGESLAPILKGNQPDDWRDAIYYHYQMKEPEGRTSHLVAKHYGVRTAKHKLIYFYELDSWEFYDLESDPHETRNQYGNPEFASLVADMKKQLTKFRSKYGDTTGRSF